MRSIVLLSFLLIFSIVFSTAFSQADRKMTRDEYISEYKNLAIKEMERKGIPASISLAQGILESGNGNSRLAVKANNHFGIKCHDWKGKKIRHDDDLKRECFRKYKSVYESYKDHSDFLAEKKRYSFLFALDPTDYEEWAKGLKKAGYATSRNYDKALIKIIEENQLYAYDQGIDVPERIDQQLASVNNYDKSSRLSRVLERNRIKYIIARKGDTYSSISDEFDLLPWELRKYNELDEGARIDSGQVLYLQPKRKKAATGNKIHMVDEGETMYSISQEYGIKLSHLYKKNLMEEGTQPEAGQVLQLRKGLKGSKSQIELSLREEEQEEDKIEIEFEFDPEDEQPVIVE
jgi:LysM repeat protein